MENFIFCEEHYENQMTKTQIQIRYYTFTNIQSQCQYSYSNHAFLMMKEFNSFCVQREVAFSL